MKLLILGKNGQVGWELQRALQPLGDVLALDRHQDAKTQYCGDIANFDAIAQIITQFCPDVVVNATAYTAVDKAEADVEQANLINHLAVQHLAEQCKAINALLIHYSTDYVFNGEGQASWQEDDPKAPINAYGKTKLQGEIALEQSQTKFINFRTSWVYGTHGNNFIKTMLKLAQTKDELNIIVDQIGVPTNAALIADVTAQVIRYYVLNPSLQDKLHGHYHLAPRGETSWYDFAQLIFAQARSNGVELKVKQVGAIPTTGYPTPAKRPLNSRLNTQKLQQTFYIHLPEWQQGVEHVIAEII
ncbi:MAG TPA: dTDP-4-dehydrorhamnose reductase [Acinetobacter ursingii]|uniref:dTDP-4-dehydrorhamnose reductase n=1 Tax=Acinetobacter ursingii TaxID=108980 RepID=A0A3D2SPB8_9GAMM|nr:dTDP-4-dehydrorhamnose reductase [Acinetobacter ursingii]MCH2006708.1 dTDP-4-dehydrorhamnose reductase [Acinetobacter ursingii]MCH2014369.1 dTDP-4-dehydrorhamnose reductase [Acinetobacter ursingii]PPZ93455.1 dTDP-4-dehydrorhamnose reductase [Acinetobacter ursingii]HCK31256.1 dTDP-4-dehydrorhamnose reductase [Acinetobacter ursingii]HCO06912.1 dTDP-4-dehydrorhamnose reductase [Acinetobacter ursingii]